LNKLALNKKMKKTKEDIYTKPNQSLQTLPKQKFANLAKTLQLSHIKNITKQRYSL